jgi:hypothetical protein
MKQVYHNYLKWEDYKNGMWRKESREYEVKMLPKVIEFTGNHVTYGKAMMEVVTKWEYACEHNLTDLSQNRKAWVGHAAVCYKIGVPEHITRMAWGYLSQDQQNKANRQAELAINHWFKLQQKSFYAQTEIRY